MARAAQPVENALAFSTARPSLASSDTSAKISVARSASGIRSPCPIEPSMRTRGCSPAFSASARRSRERGAHARAAAREPVQQPQHRRAHDVVRRVAALGRAMLGDDPAVEARDLVAREGHALAHADAGREAVDAVAAQHDALDEGARLGHPGEGLGSDLDTGARARDSDHIADVERGAVDDDGSHSPRLYDPPRGALVLDSTTDHES